MIEGRSQILLIAASVLLIITVWQLIKRDRLKPAYALVWLITSFGFFFFALFKELGRQIANFFSVEYAPSFYFALALFFIIILLLFHASVLSSNSKKTTELAQHLAILQWRVEQLEEQIRQISLLEISSLDQNQIGQPEGPNKDDELYKFVNLIDEDKTPQ
jgi:hypothetical protein